MLSKLPVFVQFALTVKDHQRAPSSASIQYSSFIPNSFVSIYCMGSLTFLEDLLVHANKFQSSKLLCLIFNLHTEICYLECTLLHRRVANAAIATPAALKSTLS